MNRTRLAWALALLMVIGTFSCGPVVRRCLAEAAHGTLFRVRGQLKHVPDLELDEAVSNVLVRAVPNARSLELLANEPGYALTALKNELRSRGRAGAREARSLSGSGAQNIPSRGLTPVDQAAMAESARSIQAALNPLERTFVDALVESGGVVAKASRAANLPNQKAGQRLLERLRHRLGPRASALLPAGLTPRIRTDDQRSESLQEAIEKVVELAKTLDTDW